MTDLTDEPNRRRALTDLDATLLVEAAAGTGKTSLLAGRVLVLLAAAVPPREIAAITFTEFAAGELRERVTHYLEEVLAGRVPVELRLAFPLGVAESQKSGLWQARARMDELTSTTIHGFCHDLLRTCGLRCYSSTKLMRSPPIPRALLAVKCFTNWRAWAGTFALA
jgi:CRISPR-associated exonuclease Cas4